MQQKTLWSKKLSLMALTALFFLFLCMGISWLSKPWLLRYHTQIERVMSEVVQHETHFQDVYLSWWGVSPRLVFTKVRVKNLLPSEKDLEIEEVAIMLRLFKSLYHREWQFGKIFISGSHIALPHLSGTGAFVLSKNSASNMLNKIPDFFHAEGILLNKICVTLISSSQQEIHLDDIEFFFKHWEKKWEVRTHLKLNQGQKGSLLFIANLSSEMDDTLPKVGQSYLAFNGVDVAYFQPFFQDALPISGVLSGQTWLEIKNGGLDTWHTEFRISSGSFREASDTLIFHRLTAHILWQRMQEGWRLSGDHLSLMTPQFHLKDDRFYIESTSTQNGMKRLVQMDFLPLDPVFTLLKRWNILPQESRNYLEATQLGGLLKNLYLVQTEGVSFPDIFSTEFERIHAKTTQGIPGGEGLAGRLFLTPKWGKLELRSELSQLDLGSLFPKPLSWQHLFADVYWFKYPRSIRIIIPKVMGFNADVGMLAKAGFVFDLSMNKPWGQVIGNVHVNHPVFARDYFPVGILKPNLIQWLNQAFLGGKEALGSLHLEGPLTYFPFPHQEGIFVIQSDVRHIDLRFDKDWPIVTNLSATLRFNGPSMAVDLREGQIYGSPITRLQARIPAILPDVQAVLSVDSAINTDLQIGQKVIDQSPPLSSLSKELHHFKLNGPVSLQLSLTLPLEEGAVKRKVEGVIKLEAGQLAHRKYPLFVSKIGGQLAFTEDVLYSDHMTGELLNRPITLQFSPGPLENGKPSGVRLDLAGEFDSDSAFKEWGVTLPVTGRTSLSSHIFWKNQGNDKTIQFESLLKGVALDLPAPFKKSADETWPMTMMVMLPKDASAQLKISLPHRGFAWLNIDEKSLKLLGGEITFPDPLLDHSLSEGVEIEGKIDTLDAGPWIRWFKKMTKKSESNKNLLKSLDLTARRLNFSELKLSNTHLFLEDEEDRTSYTIQSNEISGQLLAFKKKTWQLNLDKVLLPKSNEAETKEMWNASDLPDMNIECKDLRYQGKKLGRFSTQMRSFEKGVMFKDIMLSLPFYRLSGEAEWIQDPENHSHVKGNFEFEDFEKFLKLWISNKVLFAKKGKAGFDIQYPSAPWQVQLAKLSGNVEIKLGKGYIANTPTAGMRAGQILNFVSLDSLRRRLSLDFSDWTQKGLSFDNLQGHFALEKGQAVTHDASFDGPVAFVGLDGRIGLVSKDFDAKLTINPYVTSSLPVVATLAGGPVVGAVTWVANQLVNPAVKKFTTQTYHMTGPWDNPDLKLTENGEKNESHSMSKVP